MSPGSTSWPAPNVAATYSIVRTAPNEVGIGTEVGSISRLRPSAVRGMTVAQPALDNAVQTCTTGARQHHRDAVRQWLHSRIGPDLARRDRHADTCWTVDGHEDRDDLAIMVADPYGVRRLEAQRLRIRVLTQRSARANPTS